MPKLIDNRRGKEHYVVTDPATIGRHPSNDIVLTGLTLSRYHAEIRSDGVGYCIEDLRSTYGTFVNDTKLDGSVAIKEGDLIRFGVSDESPEGEYCLSFSLEEAPTNASSALLDTALGKSDQISFERQDGNILVKLQGAFRQPECEKLVELVVEEVSDSPATIVIDLEMVTYMNRHVLQPFLQLWLKVNQRGCRIGLACAQGNILKLLQDLGIAGQFQCYESPFEAFQQLNEE